MVMQSPCHGNAIALPVRSRHIVDALQSTASSESGQRYRSKSAKSFDHLHVSRAKKSPGDAGMTLHAPHCADALETAARAGSDPTARVPIVVQEDLTAPMLSSKGELLPQPAVNTVTANTANRTRHFERCTTSSTSAAREPPPSMLIQSNVAVRHPAVDVQWHSTSQATHGERALDRSQQPVRITSIGPSLSSSSSAAQLTRARIGSSVTRETLRAVSRTRSRAGIDSGGSQSRVLRLYGAGS